MQASARREGLGVGAHDELVEDKGDELGHEAHVPRLAPHAPAAHEPRDEMAALPRARRERRREARAGTHHQSMISWIWRSTVSSRCTPNACDRLSAAIFVAQFLYDLNVR